MKTLYKLIIAAICLGSVILLIRKTGDSQTPTQTPKEIMRAKSLEQNAKASQSLRVDQRTLKLANNPLDRSQLPPEAAVLDDPQAQEIKVQTAIHTLLSSICYMGKEKSYPAGLNVEITNTLLGLNSRKFGYLPADSKRINENGELVDQYGTPYWFHSKTSKDLTITSAGPDRLMHTEDDMRYPLE